MAQEIPASALLPYRAPNGAFPEHVIYSKAARLYVGWDDASAATAYRHARTAVHYALTPWGTYTVLASKGRS